MPSLAGGSHALQHHQIAQWFLRIESLLAMSDPSAMVLCQHRFERRPCTRIGPRWSSIEVCDAELVGLSDAFTSSTSRWVIEGLPPMLRRNLNDEMSASSVEIGFAVGTSDFAAPLLLAAKCSSTLAAQLGTQACPARAAQYLQSSLTAFRRPRVPARLPRDDADVATRSPFSPPHFTPDALKSSRRDRPANKIVQSGVPQGSKSARR